MNRISLAILIALSTVAAYGFYYFVPHLWQLESDWDIIATEKIIQETVNQYHQTWWDRIRKQGGLSFVKENQCELTENLWHCQYLISNYTYFTKLQYEIDQGYQEASGWVLPDELQAEQETLILQTRTLAEAITSLDQQINETKDKLKPKQKTAEDLAQQLSLFEKNIDLRQQQLDIYKQLLPTMDKSSQLYQVYVQKSETSEKRLMEIHAIARSLQRRIEKEAPEWNTLQDLTDQKQADQKQMQEVQNMVGTYTRALGQIHHGKVPQPSEYAFLFKEKRITPIRKPAVFFPAFLTFFLLLANLWIYAKHWFEKKPELTSEPTIVDTDETV
ncbi:MAG: hypothetical protein KDK51_01745 [Deltaproteobacteria bacterium]|nr:hypothetical protein [Deltaproteobacteria bacterium]